MSEPRKVDVQSLAGEPVDVDLWGYSYRRAVITRMRGRKLREAENRMEQVSIRAENRAKEQAERPDPSPTEADIKAEDDDEDEIIKALASMLDVFLTPAPVDGDGLPPQPSKVVWDKWEADELARGTLLELLAAIGQGSEDPTAASPTPS